MSSGSQAQSLLCSMPSLKPLVTQSTHSNHNDQTLWWQEVGYRCHDPPYTAQSSHETTLPAQWQHTSHHSRSTEPPIPSPQCTCQVLLVQEPGSAPPPQLEPQAGATLPDQLHPNECPDGVTPPMRKAPVRQFRPRFTVSKVSGGLSHRCAWHCVLDSDTGCTAVLDSSNRLPSYDA